MKRIAALFSLWFVAVVYVAAQCPATYNFSGSGVVLNSADWSQPSPSGTSLLFESSGSVAPVTAGTQGIGVWTGSSCTPGPDQYSQVISGTLGGYSGPWVRATTAGNGYLWALDKGLIFTMTTFGGNAIISCPVSTPGHTYRLLIKGTRLTGFEDGVQVCSDSDSTYATGNPAVGVDSRSSSDSLSSFQTGVAPLDAPSFSPLPNTFTTPQTVTLTPPSGALACGTIDGSTPTATTAGTCTNGGPGPFTVSINTTIRAISTEAGQTNSVPATGVYTIRAPETFWIRQGGGTPTQCTGLSDADYPGTGTGRGCAFNDLRYMWSGNDGTPGAGTWRGASGDTVVIRGCAALSSQVNPDNPHCRIGYDNPNDGNPPNSWCPNVPNTLCNNPSIPAGTAGAHTRIIGQCVLVGNCNTGNTTNRGNLTQIFGGFGISSTFNLTGTQYVDVIGIELTSHNGLCTVNGSPTLRGCSTNSPLDDYAQNGFHFDNTSSNITLQDIYIHGLNSWGIFGPIGGPITMTRVFDGFNGMGGWSFDDGNDTPNAPGSQILASYQTMMGNGCYEEYPIVHTGFPARACYDSVSNGFGDGWSGQDTNLDVFHCDHCQLLYNTKDGFIGPHTQITDLKITNSYAYGNMGSTWKWGATNNSTVLFQNNLSVGNCVRMEETVPGAVKNFEGIFITNVVVSGGVATITTSTQALTAGQQVFFWSFQDVGPANWVNGLTLTVLSTGLTANQFEATVSHADGTYTSNGATSVIGSGAYLTNYCRAGGAQFATITRSGSSNQYIGNTVIGAAPLIFQQNCGHYIPGNIFIQETDCGSVPQLYTDNIFLGFNDPAIGNFPGLYFPETSSIIFTGSWNNEFGIKSGTGDACGTNNITCVNPLLTAQPTSPWPGSETALDVFTPGTTGNSFLPATGSPIIAAGTSVSGWNTDYFGLTRSTTHPTLGAVELGGVPPVNPSITYRFSGTVKFNR